MKHTRQFIVMTREPRDETVHETFVEARSLRHAAALLSPAYTGDSAVPFRVLEIERPGPYGDDFIIDSIEVGA
ncbi:MAG: hypothetical protein CMO68_06075 [Verrucomicrobiales bacterium]|nr:hypothetical protein [Verrucomicrobiales bacterium]|tara:strand:+ start:740 stop:958 length:219 start_codon:yes stop_codon:yes gene_type:complete